MVCNQCHLRNTSEGCCPDYALMVVEFQRWYPHLSFADKVGSVEPFNLLGRWVPDGEKRKKILADNPQKLFGF